MYLYALAEPLAARSPAPASAGEALRVVACARVVAVVGDMRPRRRWTRPRLRAHDDAVRRVAAAAAGACFPRASGRWPRTRTSSGDALTRPPTALREALDLVRGCEQMTLRVSTRRAARAAAAPAPPDAPPAGRARAISPRARAARRAARRPRAAAAARRASRRSSRAETRRAARHAAAAGHRLPPRSRAGRREDYLAAVRDASRAPPGGPRLASGPWPPYAFARGACVKRAAAAGTSTLAGGARGARRCAPS